MKYRKEIDGLRAFAVLPVVAFHSVSVLLPGGYLGVDIFFVISGFLITRIIADALDEGRFRLIDFYERRARRILPALVAMVLIVTPLAYRLMVLEEWNKYLASLFGVGAFVSNVIFFRQSGYFDTDASLKPLLHAWSLSVEEQYYLFAPLLLLLIWRVCRNRLGWAVAAIGGISLISLLASDYASRVYPSANFYLIPTRAWELGAGALAALYLRHRALRGNDALALLGLGLIVASYALFSEGSRVPSLLAAPPILGAVLVLVFARSEGRAGQLLANRPAVFVGKISYSLYLWHHPVLALWRLYAIEPMTPAQLPGLYALMFGLAVLSWKFVETPFRAHGARARISCRAVFALSIMALGSFVTAGFIGHRLTQHTEREVTECSRVAGRPCFDLPSPQRTVALWGDSFADAFARSLGNDLNARNVALDMYVMHACPAILGVVKNEPLRQGPSFSTNCQRHTEQAVQDIVARRPDVVVISTNFAGLMVARNEAHEWSLIDPDAPGKTPTDFVPERLIQTLRALERAGSQIVLLLPHPFVPEFYTERKRYRRGLAPSILANRTLSIEFSARLEGDLTDARLPVRLLTIDDLVCTDSSERNCSIVGPAGRLTLYDGNHISTLISGAVARRVEQAIFAQ